MKRQVSIHKTSVSPPLSKRKLESTTTSKAVASFFKPASQKEPEKLTWRLVNRTLVVGRYADSDVPSRPHTIPVKVAAFDLDDTIIAPANPRNKWARSTTSWRWWNRHVPGRLRELYKQGYLVVLLSNQSSISLKDDPKKLQQDSASLMNFKKCMTAVLQQLDIPISIYAATGEDNYRKPRTSMWDQMKDDFEIQGTDMIDMSNSFYVGDAAGRDKTDTRPQDHSTSDRDLAANIGIGFYTPDEFFLNSPTEPYIHKFEPAKYLANAPTVAMTTPFAKVNSQDIIMFCGSPGSGKSSFYWSTLEPLNYQRVNQDILKTRDRCLSAARQYLEQGLSVAIDNTNRDTETRAHWVRLAKEFNIPIRCIHFTASARLCQHNDIVRSLNKQMNPESRTALPPIAFIDFAKRFTEPSLSEGFQDITQVNFVFVGTDEQRRLWSRYWVSKFST